MKIRLRIASLVLIFLSPLSSWAFRLSPMIANFAPSGSGSTQTFLVENTGTEKVAIQIEAFHRYADEQGKESRTATDEFSVYPQQMALQPNEKRNIRVTWTGSRQPDRELNYRLVVTELPVDLKKPKERENKLGASLTFLMQYVASLYVTPPSATSKLVVDSFKVMPDGEGLLVLKNTGLAHRVLKGTQVFVRTGKDSRTELKGEQIEQMQGENVLSLSSRRFLVPLSAALSAALVRAEKANPGTVKAEIELN